MTQSIFRSIAKWLSIAFLSLVAVLFVLWFVIFNWNIIPYPSNPAHGPDICYSPNHSYYVKRYQPIFYGDWLYQEGLVILYDAKTNKELYREKAYLSEMAGPVWSDKVVYYEGAYGNFYIKLPASPGAHPVRDKGCFNEISTYVPPPVEAIPDRGWHLESVEPLEPIKTQAPYQMQFWLHDDSGKPYVGKHYLIIRKDNSRVRGVTDENGRTVVVESQNEETVTYFSPPDNGMHEAYSTPEGLITSCKEIKKWGGDCFNPKDYTFTVKTIKIESAN